MAAYAVDPKDRRQSAITREVARFEIQVDGDVTVEQLVQQTLDVLRDEGKLALVKPVLLCEGAEITDRRGLVSRLTHNPAVERRYSQRADRSSSQILNLRLLGLLSNGWSSSARKGHRSVSGGPSQSEDWSRGNATAAASTAQGGGGGAVVTSIAGPDGISILSGKMSLSHSSSATQLASLNESIPPTQCRARAGGQGDVADASSTHDSRDSHTAAEAFAALDNKVRGVLALEDVATLGQIMGKSMTKTELAAVFCTESFARHCFSFLYNCPERLHSVSSYHRKEANLNLMD